MIAPPRGISTTFTASANTKDIALNHQRTVDPYSTSWVLNTPPVLTGQAHPLLLPTVSPGAWKERAGKGEMRITQL